MCAGTIFLLRPRDPLDELLVEICSYRHICSILRVDGGGLRTNKGI